MSSNVPWSKVAFLGMVIPPLIGILRMSFKKPPTIGLMSLSPNMWKQWELIDPSRSGWPRSHRANAQPVVEDLPMEFPMWLMPARVALTERRGRQENLQLAFNH